MMKKLTLSLSLLIPFSLFSQLDTMVVYDVASQTLEVVPPVDFDTTIAFEMTSSNMGSLPGSVALISVPPTENLIDGSQFTHIAPAAGFFSVMDYPIRTAVKILFFNADTFSFSCSGQLVGCRTVLTAGHCMFNDNLNEWNFDQIEVVPAFDNGVPQPGLPTASAESCFLFKKHIDDDDYIDLGLIQLNEPIGEEVGWIGIAHAEDDFFAERVFHKLSYPVDASTFGMPGLVNGDTLYYDYGFIGLSPWGNIMVEGAFGIPGQSGSSLFTEVGAGGVASLGVSSFSTNYQHERILPGLFHQMKNVIQTCLTSDVPPGTEADFQVDVFPNPFFEKTTLQFSNPFGSVFQLQLFDMHGQLILEESGNGESIEIRRGELTAGVYGFRLNGLGAKPVSGKLIAR